MSNAIRIQEALVTLREATARGIEYPDAEFRVAQRYGLKARDVEKLRALYDSDDEAES